MHRCQMSTNDSISGPFVVTKQSRVALSILAFSAVLLNCNTSAAQNAGWADYRNVDFRFHNGAGYSLGTTQGVTVHNEMIVGIVRAHTDVARYRYSSPEHWQRYREWNFQVVPEFGVTSLITLGDSQNIYGVHFPIGVRIRRSWNMVAVGGSLHAFFGALIFGDNEATEREPGEPEEPARFGLGSRLSFQVDFFPERLLGIELVYTIQTDAVDTYVHSFTGILFLNFLAIRCNNCGFALFMTG